MAKTREIRRRIKAVGNIQRITKTMQMIATARFQVALNVVTRSRAYATKIGELVGELVPSLGGRLDHPLLRHPEDEGGRVLLLVITSQRGLCGAFNANVLRQAMAFLRQHQGRGVDVEVVGKKGVAFLRFNGVPVAAVHGHITDRPAYADVEQLAERYIDRFSDGTYNGVYIASATFQTMARQTPGIGALLPLASPASSDPKTPGGAQAGVEYDFSPDPEALLNELLPITVKTQLFQRFNEAALSEHIARMIAMKNATDSAGKMSKQLKLRFNRARQAAITTELSEIIGGSAALA